MLKLIRIGLIAFLVSATVPSSAHAISIGLLGGDVDPELPLITDIGFSFLSVDGCGFPDLEEGLFCAPYEVPNDGDSPFVIDSIDFRMTKPGGGFYSSIADFGLFGVTELSDLPSLSPSTLFPDGFTFALFDPLFLSLDCPSDGVFCRADFYADSPDVVSVSIVGVNGVANPGASAIPEPVTLVLLGVGTAGVVARRRSARRG